MILSVHQRVMLSYTQTLKGIGTTIEALIEDTQVSVTYKLCCFGENVQVVKF